MSYLGAPSSMSASRLLGNPGSTAAAPSEISLDSSLAFSAGALSAIPASGRSTSGNITLQSSDNLTSMYSTSATGVTYTLPAGLAYGFRCRSYQKGAGQITYAAGAGATVLNTAAPVKSGGLYTGKFYADIENMGNDTWLVTGNLA